MTEIKSITTAFKTGSSTLASSNSTFASFQARFPLFGGSGFPRLVTAFAVSMILSVTKDAFGYVYASSVTGDVKINLINEYNIYLV